MPRYLLIPTSITENDREPNPSISFLPIEASVTSRDSILSPWMPRREWELNWQRLKVRQEHREEVDEEGWIDTMYIDAILDRWNIPYYC